MHKPLLGEIPIADLERGYSGHVGMRATTVRFGEDLWAMLERESRRVGVSAAQFVREATIMRLGAIAGGRGDQCRDQREGKDPQVREDRE